MTKTLLVDQLARVRESALSIVGPEPDYTAVNAAVAATERDATELAAELRALTIVDDATNIKVTELMGIAKTFAGELEAARLAITAPLKKRAKVVEDLVRPVAAALDAIVAAGKNAQLAYLQAQERARRAAAEEVARKNREAEAALAREREAAAAENRPVEIAKLPAFVPVAAPEPVRGVKTAYGTSQLSKVWTFVVEDVQRVPRQYLVVDEKAITLAIRAGVREIDGVSIFQKDQLAVGGR